MESSKALIGPSICIGDFNMVEHSKDRWEGLGKIFKGTELKSWSSLKDHLFIVDLGSLSEYTSLSTHGKTIAKGS